MNLAFSYRPLDSPIHRMSPFVMLAWVLVVVVGATLAQHPFWLLALLLVSPPVAWAAGVMRPWAAMMRWVLLMGLFIVAVNVVVSQQGTHLLFDPGVRLPLLGSPRITLEAIAFGGAMALRLAAIISAFTLLNLCVHPDELMRAAIKLKLPYRSVLVTSLSTRFVPVLLNDARTVMDVQRSRGLSFGRGNLIERVRNGGTLIFPLLSNSLDRAVQVSEAMEARGYGARVKRTFYRDRSMTAAEVALLLVVCGAAVLLLVARAAGLMEYQYYPALDDVVMSAPSLAAMLLVCAMLLSVVVRRPSARSASDD